MGEIFVLGINHKTAPVKIREQISVPMSMLENLYSKLRGENVVISTCNRVELYTYVQHEHDAYFNMSTLIKEVSGLSLQDLKDYIYVKEGRDAWIHLFKVAGGLDSMVIGESEILHQVVDAYHYAKEQKATGKFLNKLFQLAIHTGKRIRSETTISKGFTSVASAATYLAKKFYNNLEKRKATVVGAGRMAQTIIKYLLKLGLKDIVVINRTEAKARALSNKFNIKWGSLNDLTIQLETSDVIFFAIGGGITLLNYESFSGIKRHLSYSPLLIIDISVPRVVNPDVSQVKGVILKDIDSVKHVVEEGIHLRSFAIEQANNIIKESVDEFASWLKLRSISEVIHVFDVNTHKLLTLIKSQNSSLTSSEIEAIEFFIKSLSNVIASNLRDFLLKGNEANSEQVIKLLSRLFLVHSEKVSQN